MRYRQLLVQNRRSLDSEWIICIGEDTFTRYIPVEQYLEEVSWGECVWPPCFARYYFYALVQMFIVELFGTTKSDTKNVFIII